MAATYPLFFGFRDAIEGNGFLAGVAINGRALMVHEGEVGGWWLYGVTPAGIAATGETPPEAHAAFRNAYRQVLFDAAAGAETFEAFKAEVERFFNEGDSEEQRWEEAAAAIRSGQVTPEPPFSDLPRIPADSCPKSIAVERLDQSERSFSTQKNTLDQYALTVAAA